MFKKLFSVISLGVISFSTNLEAEAPWSCTRQSELVHAAKILAPQLTSSKAYPISEGDLQHLYSQVGSKTVSFFAYSSMIDKEAGAVKAISAEAAATQAPAVAFGIARVFNRQMEVATVEAGFGKLARPKDLAILNVFQKEDAALNGVIFELPIEDLLILTKREVGYDLIPIVVTSWNEALDETKTPKFFLAYTFQAQEGTSFTSAKVNPIPPYFNNLQKGLDLMGYDFKAMWWSTTYMADQKTLVNELPR